MWKYYEFFILIYYKYKLNQYNVLNVKFSDSQINKLKSGIKSGTDATSKISSNAVGDSKMRTIFHINYY